MVGQVLAECVALVGDQQDVVIGDVLSAHPHLILDLDVAGLGRARGRVVGIGALGDDLTTELLGGAAERGGEGEILRLGAVDQEPAGPLRPHQILDQGVGLHRPARDHVEHVRPAEVGAQVVVLGAAIENQGVLGLRQIGQRQEVLLLEVGDDQAVAGGELVLECRREVAVLGQGQLVESVGLAEEAAGRLVVLDRERGAGDALVGQLARLDQRERRQLGGLRPGHVQDLDLELRGSSGGRPGARQRSQQRRQRRERPTHAPDRGPALIMGSLLYWGPRQMENRLERAVIAHKQVPAYLQLALEADRHLQQLSSGASRGRPVSDAELEASRRRLTDMLADLRRLTLDELTFVGRAEPAEKVEMDRIARFEHLLNRAFAVTAKAETETPREFARLEYLMRSAGKVVSRALILEKVWGCSRHPLTNVVGVYIRQLRRKIDRDAAEPPIQTVRGFGYKLRDF